MKPVLLHGPALVSSRKKLAEIKNQFGRNSVVVFEKGTDTANILASLQTVSVFDEDRLVVAENPPEAFLLDLSISAYHSPLIVWFDHEIKKLPDQNQWDVLLFPEAKEVSVFPWLDKLIDGKTEAFLELARLKGSGFEIQYFLTMVFYLLRNLVTDPVGAKDFVKRKNARARLKFSRERVKACYRFVLELDFKIKSGLLEPNQAEFLLVERFVSG